MTQVREEWCIRRGKGVNAAWKRSECGVEKAADPMRKRHAFDGEKAAEPPKDNAKQSLGIYDTMDASRSARSAAGKGQGKQQRAQYDQRDEAERDDLKRRQTKIAETPHSVPPSFPGRKNDKAKKIKTASAFLPRA